MDWTWNERGLDPVWLQILPEQLEEVSDCLLRWEGQRGTDCQGGISAPSLLSVRCLHYLPKFAQIHVHGVSNAFQPSHPLPPPSPSAFNLSRHQGPNNQLFTSGGPSIGASASAPVLPMSIQGGFPLGLTGLISLHFKGLSRVFSSTTIWKQQRLYYYFFWNSF